MLHNSSLFTLVKVGKIVAEIDCVNKIRILQTGMVILTVFQDLNGK